MDTKIGFIGLGHMGTPMAKHLLNAGYHLQVYNRTLSKIDELGEGAITKCKSPADAADGASMVITMLSEDEVLKETVLGENGILKKLPKGAVHISMSTIAPDTAQLLSDAHKAAGNSYLASPVLADQKQQPLRNYGFVYRETSTQKTWQNQCWKTLARALLILAKVRAPMW
ncbi:NAD(P)-dependent oxidoreductase [Mucilaginibacter gotjawali]|uniref:3-hydroxyisobutyrate dehydrogenase-like beta-hydroxyacid dehydrogenase n=2 Tax=Mucilaginibacter gotjawali TaxID=1550579 RepID=A0A839SJJ1_9SPHI|nr:NAD(P)-dependent oxidoreductase [Mucilaginibacter gotjawali]MBB3057602.1 3-hydroxyisobutyrate dehydrogenase-like beta-hydroxyacid dehydrogenase [Mucilaginibacter gotjawali]BAU55263.1 2-hydroxy-3-oxopropionate reductase [Mucilaginibacter gotjawali]